MDVLVAKGINEIYCTGLASGTCVLATVLDAIKLKNPMLKVHAVPDCMGWRRYETHVDAIERLQKMPEVTLTNSGLI